MQVCLMTSHIKTRAFIGLKSPGNLTLHYMALHYTFHTTIENFSACCNISLGLLVGNKINYYFFILVATPFSACIPSQNAQHIVPVTFKTSQHMVCSYKAMLYHTEEKRKTPTMGLIHGKSCIFPWSICDNPPQDFSNFPK